MLKKLFSFAFFVTFFSIAQAASPKVYFVSPKNNETVAKVFKAKFGQSGIVVKPAGEDVENINA